MKRVDGTVKIVLGLVLAACFAGAALSPAAGADSDGTVRSATSLPDAPTAQPSAPSPSGSSGPEVPSLPSDDPSISISRGGPYFALDGDCRVDSIVSVDLGGYTGDVSFQWGVYSFFVDDDERPFSPIPGAIGREFRVTPDLYPRATEWGGNAELAVQIKRAQDTYATMLRCSVDLGSAPAVVTPPTVTGAVTVGSVASFDPGTYSTSVEVSKVAWFVEGQRVSSSPSPTIEGSYVGKGLAVEVTMSSSKYRAGTYRSEPRIVQPGGVAPFVLTTPPLVKGEAAVGSTLRVSGAIVSPGPNQRRFQWYRDGVAVPNGTATTLLLSKKDVGHAFTVAETASLNGWQPATFTSDPTIPVLDRFTTMPAPSVAGKAVVGSPLTASHHTWEPAGITFTYRWLRDGLWISGATKKTYVLTEEDAGKRITVDVTGTKTGFVAVKRSSSSTAAVVRVFSSVPSPRIVGKPTVGTTLRASTPPWSPAPVKLAYQWKRDGVSITGATNSTYKLIDADFKKRISVSVIGTKDGYAKEIRTSGSTTLVLRALQSSKTPTIGGSSQVGSTLTAYAGTWTPSPVELSYQWKRDGVAIDGANAKTYKVIMADRGGRLTVTVTGQKPGHAPLTKTSVSTLVS